MDAVGGPVVQRLEPGEDLLQHLERHRRVGLGLFVRVEREVVVGESVEEIDLLGDVGEPFAAGLQQRRDLGGGIRLVLHALADERLSGSGEVLGRHIADIVGVEVGELFDVENGGGLGDARNVEGLGQLGHGEELLLGALAARRPAEERHIVENGGRQEALRLEVLVARVAVALGHFVLAVAHDGGAVDVGRDLPAERLVEQVVLRRGGKVLAAADHMGDAHEMIVDDVGEVVGRQAVALQKHLIVKRLVLHRDVAEDGVVEGGGALLGDALADDVGLAGGDAGLCFLKRQVAAGIVRAVELAGILGALRLFAEAVIGAAALDEQLGVFAVGVAALGLDVGSHGAADVGAFVVVESALGQRAVDDVGRALDEAALVGILDAEDEGAARVARNEPGVERGAQVADVHIAGGGGSEARADLAVRDLRLHLVEVRHIKGHGVTS